MTYLVDSDGLIFLTRNNQGAIGFIDGLQNEWAICTVTGLELMVGAKNQREVAEIERLLTTFGSIHLTETIERRAYEILKRYARSYGIRTLDSLIAASAIEEGLILATRNRRHFAMIDDLTLNMPVY
jgi:predicted nucleic acid-binding protein